MLANDSLNFAISKSTIVSIKHLVQAYLGYVIFGFLIAVSLAYFVYYLNNGLGLAYNDARSHLDIGRRVVENLNPGLAQLGSVWLPLPHLLMVPTIWHDFMWHSGLSGAIQSMISFVATGLIIYQFLKRIGVGLLGRFAGVAIFAANLNVLYLQSTAMNELLLIALMTAGAYYLVMWFKEDTLLDLIKAAFFIMLSVLTRYDGWFLLFMATVLIVGYTWRKKGYKVAEGMIILFLTLASLGVGLWLLWNKLIFNDWLYFATGPFSAKAQQLQLEAAGNLATKGNLWLSVSSYLLALAYNSYTLPAILGLVGAVAFWWDKKIAGPVRLASIILLAPLFFNVLALYLGHSVLFIQGISGNTWFNVRYGVMLLPSIAIFIGYLVHRAKAFRPTIIGLLIFVLFFAFTNRDAVTIDDARVGSSQKNVSEVSGWLKANTANEPGYILISAASHDAIIFSPTKQSAAPLALPITIW
ncbi:MAG: hypothetical protein HYS86_01810 [Candidatus Chisholmbacteria bacterium]|nr:hypothetical protein [Candidatus Chisholmbacteria bacterium]